jgi:hypothetical protein
VGKRVTSVLALAAVLLAGAAAAAWPQGEEKAPPAKAASLNGTVVSVSGVRVEIAVEGDKPAWVKKGSGIKVKGGLGKIVEVAAGSVAFNTKKASAIKVGEKLVVDKGTVVPAGC